jgi:hypothetical protein
MPHVTKRKTCIAGPFYQASVRDPSGQVLTSVSSEWGDEVFIEFRKREG